MVRRFQTLLAGCPCPLALFSHFLELLSSQVPYPHPVPLSSIVGAVHPRCRQFLVYTLTGQKNNFQKSKFFTIPSQNLEEATSAVAVFSSSPSQSCCGKEERIGAGIDEPSSTHEPSPQLKACLRHHTGCHAQQQVVAPACTFWDMSLGRLDFSTSFWASTPCAQSPSPFFVLFSFLFSAFEPEGSFKDMGLRAKDP